MPVCHQECGICPCDTSTTSLHLCSLTFELMIADSAVDVCQLRLDIANARLARCGEAVRGPAISRCTHSRGYVPRRIEPELGTCFNRPAAQASQKQGVLMGLMPVDIFEATASSSPLDGPNDGATVACVCWRCGMLQGDIGCRMTGLIQEVEAPNL